MVLVLVSVASMFVGRGTMGDHTTTWGIFLPLRFWRLAAAFGIGASLSMAGVLVQAIFQNPLAGPSIIGTTAGAALGGQFMMILYSSSFAVFLAQHVGYEVLIPLGATLGAIGSLFLLLSITRRAQGTWITLLVGFLLTSFFTSIGAYVVSKAQSSWELGRAVLAYSLGTISSVGPKQVIIVWIVSLIGFVAAMTWHRHLDMLLTGDDEAQTFGLNVKQTRRWSILWAGVLSAGAVAIGGSVAFVGLVVPHAMRRFVGYDTARLLPACAVNGGTFVIFCDILARLGTNQGETPLGVITGLIGAPVFLYLLLRTHRAETLND